MTAYSIKLYDIEIGVSALEKADPPLGQVCGKIQFNSDAIPSGYDFFSAYCQETESQINVNYPDYKFLDAENIRGLSVFTEDGQAIAATSMIIRGFDSEGFEIELNGIEKTVYQELFPEHTAAYDNQFSMRLNA